MTILGIDRDHVVNTDLASGKWREERDWDGHYMCGRSSGSHWHDQVLFRAKNGRFYTVTYSRVEGENDCAEWISPTQAIRWLLLNEHILPDDLEGERDQVEL